MANGFKHLSVIQSRSEGGSERAAEPGHSIFDGPMPSMVGMFLYRDSQRQPREEREDRLATSGTLATMTLEPSF